LLWLDVDVVVLDDLRPLAGIDLEGCYVAGVDDMLMHRPGHLELLGIEPSTGYFNAGVLVLDVEAIRRDGKDVTLVSETQRLAPWLFWRDQDALNVVLGERRLRLHPRWNVTFMVLFAPLANRLYGETAAREAVERPGVRHFLGKDKPWLEGRPPPYAEAYWLHRRATPFAEA
jgi:lipopolysaccharide biosynthesis glycosyltransferase